MKTERYKDMFLATASGESLDFIGLNFGVTRNAEESDESYRARITPKFEEHRMSLISGGK